MTKRSSNEETSKSKRGGRSIFKWGKKSEGEMDKSNNLAKEGFGNIGLGSEKPFAKQVCCSAGIRWNGWPYKEIHSFFIATAVVGK